MTLSDDTEARLAIHGPNDPGFYGRANDVHRISHPEPGTRGDTEAAFAHIDYFAAPGISSCVGKFSHYTATKPWPASFLEIVVVL
jgi:hypothetical protein